MDDAERAALRVRATSYGLSEAACLRRLATGRGTRALDADRAARELNRIGVNLNQIAKRANAGLDVDRAELAAIRREVLAALRGL